MAARPPFRAAPAVRCRAIVSMWGNQIGQVVEFTNGRINFTYDKNYRAGGVSISPIHLPVRPGSFEFSGLSRMESFGGLPGAIADSLPDAFGNRIIQTYFQSRGELDLALSPVQRLLYVGNRAMGALEYSPAITRRTPEEDRALEISMLAEEARRVIEGDCGDAVREIMQVGASAGGARAKALILWDRDSNRVRSGFARPRENEEPWIVKFDGIGSASAKDHGAKPYNRVEYVYALIAQSAGIEMAPVSFIEKDGMFHFATRRFDRVSGQKLHMHSLGGMEHVDYNQPQAYSYEALFRLINGLQIGSQAIEQMYRRMVFNIVGRNQDDHVKNISFLMDLHGRWKLSPAYDLTFAAGQGYTSAHQMTLAGKVDGFTREDLLNTGEMFGVRDAGHVINEVVESFSGWSFLAARHGIDRERIEDIADKLRTGLAAPADRAHSRLYNSCNKHGLHTTKPKC